MAPSVPHHGGDSEDNCPCVQQIYPRHQGCVQFQTPTVQMNLGYSGCQSQYKLKLEFFWDSLSIGWVFRFNHGGRKWPKGIMIPPWYNL